LTAAGATEALAIMAGFDNSTSLDVTSQAQYTISDTSVATVSAQGIVTAVSNGITNIVVTYGGLTVNVTVTVVIPPTLTTLTSSSTNVTLTAAGATEALAIMAGFDNSTSLDVTGQAQYTSFDTSVATVSAQGIVTAIADGTTNIVVTYGGLTVNVSVTVTTAPVLTHLTSNPANVILTSIGATQSLDITASFNDTTSLNVTSQAQYTSTDTSVATVSAQGVVTAVANGTTNIVVTYGGITKSVPVLVTVSRQLDSVYIYLAANPLHVGSSANLIVYAYFFDPSTNAQSAEEVTALATIEIEDPSIAAIDDNFYVTGLTAGTTRIKVTFLSQEFYTDLTIL